MSNQGGVLARFSNTISQSPVVRRGKQTASDAAYASKKLLKSTGKAAWMVGTTFLILVVPLIIELDREQQMSEVEKQQVILLGGGAAPAPAAPAHSK